MGNARAFRDAGVSGEGEAVGFAGRERDGALLGKVLYVGNG